MWQPDRLVALQADTDGELTLGPRECEGRELRLNYRTEPNGWIKAELMPPTLWPAEHLAPLAGHSFAECAPLRGDSLSAPVTWNGRGDLAALRGERIAIRISMSGPGCSRWRAEVGQHEGAPDAPLLSVRDLRTYFHTEDGVVPAVDGVSFDLPAGATLGIVGESGCGKSVTALSVLRLVASPPGRIEIGRILFEGQDLLRFPEPRMREIRGNEISMIFQEPMSSLNPVFSVGFQIAENIMQHQRLRKREAYGRAVEMLELVGIPAPEKRIRDTRTR